MEKTRERSPRAPSMPLEDAVQKVTQIYDREGLHAVPLDVAAGHIGYKDARNGAAKSALASLRGYGLIAYAPNSKLLVSKDVQVFKFAPNEETKKQILINWLRQPSVIANLLDKYSDHLPSEKTLLFDLIQSGFTEGTAKEFVEVFKKSVDFTHYYESKPQVQTETPEDLNHGAGEDPGKPAEGKPDQSNRKGHDSDRIPVRLSGGRRAWLEIPVPFFEQDKERIKKQVDLILVDEDEAETNEQ